MARYAASTRPPPHARHEGQRQQGGERLQRAKRGHRAGDRGPEQGRPDQPAARRDGAASAPSGVTLGRAGRAMSGALGEACATVARLG